MSFSRLPRATFAFAASILLVAGSGTSASAQSVQAPTSDPSPEAEAASFKLHEDFEVNLFADESLGIANPIAIHWDHKGRLWVLTTLAYAQLGPGEKPNDKLFILEDTDGDGKADKSSVFASGLDMPTGFALGYGGVYIGEGANLLFLKDTDGDDKADTREIVLSGFGFGDTHQNISNFTWGPDGCLYFCQGLHTYSRVETPWGIVRGDQAGFWRFHPRTLKLEPFCFPSLASQNPCGICFDKWGDMFVKSNNRELTYVTPGLIPTTNPLNLVPVASIGVTPGKSMGGEYVESTHLPDWVQNHILIAGYYSHRITAFPLIEEGAGFARVDPVELLVSSHESFRPVDIRVGPDGAIYIADWFNPIIGHYQASLRHPDRDKEHGRIWRMTAKGRKLNRFTSLEKADHLKKLLHSPERWVREQARMIQAQQMDSDPSIESTYRFFAEFSLNLPLPDTETGLCEFVGLLESAGIDWNYNLTQEGAPLNTPIDRGFGIMFHDSKYPHVRALYTRFLKRETNPVFLDEKLTQFIRDPDPRVRLEAIVTCANIPKPESLKIALRALDSETDRFINYALTQSVHALADHWLTAVKTGALELDKPEHLAFALEALGGPESTTIARGMLSKTDLTPEILARFAKVLAKVGTPEDLRELLDMPQADPGILNALIESWQTQKRRAAPPFAPRLKELIASENASVRASAISLAGLWQVKPLAKDIQARAVDPKEPVGVRIPALHALARLNGKEAAGLIAEIANAKQETPTILRRGAVEALAIVDLPGAANITSGILTTSDWSDLSSGFLVPFLNRQGGSNALAAALEKSDLKPGIAQKLATTLSTMGRTEPKLSAVINRSLGLQTEAPDYSPDTVTKLVADVRKSGDAKNGAEIYRRAQLNCIACHQVGGVGGILGPNLDTVGAGLPLDLIVESVLWPDRQLKEGFFAVTVTTKDGNIFTGYEEKGAEGILWLRDTATGKRQPISPTNIAERNNIGTLMPAGLTNSLKPEELRDLIAYLANLKGQSDKPDAPKN